MNKIYIIEKNYFLEGSNINYSNDGGFEIILNFENNTFEKDNLLYKYDIIDRDKILIYWDSRRENIIKEPKIYYTSDSYLYFLDITFKNTIKKIFLLNSEWNDQAIIDLDKMTLRRIKHNDQFGIISFGILRLASLESNQETDDLSIPSTHHDSILIIDWDYWGKERYYKIDNYTYIQEKNIEIIRLDQSKYDGGFHVPIPIHIFIHICMIENWKEIFLQQIQTIKNTGLYQHVTKIHLGILGDIHNIINDNILNDDKFDILYIDKRVTLYEIHTLNHIKSFCDNIDHEIYILYIHTKGVRKAGNENVILSWRKMMEYFLIEKYNECLKYLDIYDTLGNNMINLCCYDKEQIAINNKHTYHYSGNFWWSKKSYIDKLNYINLDLTKDSINTRYRAENWILSRYPDANIGVIFQDDTNTHPYHRYIFDYYKELKFIVKPINKR